MKNIWDSMWSLRDVRRFFSIWAVLLGVLYGFLLPPFHSPDEFNHLFKIYHLSSRSWNGELNHDSTILGGYIPRSLVEVAKPFRPQVFHEELKVPFSLTGSLLWVPLSPSDTVFQEFTNTARYAPTAYLPQVAAVWLLRQFHAPPLILLYSCRLSAFLFWFLLMLAALRLLFSTKNEFSAADTGGGGEGSFLMLVFILLPTSLAIHTTSSADVVSNALIFYALAFMLHLRARKETIRGQEAVLLLLIFVVTGINKICYFPILFFLLTIRKEKFGGFWKKIGFIGTSLVVTATVVLLWAKHVDQLIYPFGTDLPLKTTYNYLREGELVNPKLQLDIIKNDLGYYFNRFFNHSFNMYDDHHVQFIGYFGWEGKHIPPGLTNPFWWILAFFCARLPFKFAVWERLGLLTLAHSMTFLFYLSQILHWDRVGEPGEITWYGAKYFYPIYPFIFLAISGLIPDYYPKIQLFLKEKIDGNHIFMRWKRFISQQFSSNFPKINNFFLHKWRFEVFFWFLMLVLHCDLLVIMLKRYY